ncbi:hypothetical protein D917_02526 [Trichinella nativa]|uniref:Uncharacterized protein n=1 Tax=Trichinella nativa TaxID=6335 RepID=A0A1Y3EIJ9_9BILA|nr:hypothetical protein D917_02526 [Trichinella nativa]
MYILLKTIKWNKEGLIKKRTCLHVCFWKANTSSQCSLRYPPTVDCAWSLELINFFFMLFSIAQCHL